MLPQPKTLFLGFFMSVPDQTPAPPDFYSAPPPFIPAAVGVAFLSCPMLLTLVGGSGVAAFITSVGAASEELFRGDRLPPLPFPDISATPGSCTDP
ncbi:MAG TPA: hypothetical protein IGS52_02650 [Oscillatoriaceae cyanobacterium M33_DOE_052]|nr:hypothetical protein [Oscillatoriaceae cyanobacterium M33_DOE_052]